MKPRLVLPTLLVALSALLAGCGGGGEGDETDPASVVPPNASVYVDFSVRPQGEAKSDIEALAKKVAGIDDLGGRIVGELEKSASENGAKLDYAREVEPWLGGEAGIFLRGYDGDEFQQAGLALQASDEGAARDFVFKQLEAMDEPVKDGSYKGVDFKVQDDGSTFGVFDDLAVFAEEEAIFKAMVDASEGEALADAGSYTSAIEQASDHSAADVYVDIGALIEEAGGEIDSEARAFLDTVGIEPREATAVASLIPGSDQIEIDLSTDLGGDNPPSGDASELLGSLPADSVAALVSPGFGERFREGIDRLDEEGIPGEVPPHKLKKALKEAGIDLESIASSVDDVGLFIAGSNRQSLSGALVLTTEDAQQAKNTVSNIGLFLRSSGTPGVTAIDGRVSGFSIRSPDLGRRPVVVAAKGSRIAIGYGLGPAVAALEESAGHLADAPVYEEAVGALGGTPISGFADGPAALSLVDSTIAPSEERFEQAKPYLAKIGYLALGSEAAGDLATAKLIVGIGR